ncbi:leucyl/phenylalanyl-tRNA--protein transferase [Gammaproteobacteria bacterium]
MIFRLDSDPSAPFPDPEWAETTPNGLLAIGGDLSPERLIGAYRRGIFPWFDDDDPFLWWSPDPRWVLYPETLHLSRSLRKTLRRGGFSGTLDRCFDEVITACATVRAHQGTWLTAAMIEAYRVLHHQGLAHSVEIWQADGLVGGLYGVALGRIFYGESMFSRVPDASKVALVHLVSRLSAWGYRLIDCQVHTAHLEALGAMPIPRRLFLAELKQHGELEGRRGHWRDDPQCIPVMPEHFETVHE